MAELKKMADQRSALLEEAEQARKKMSRDMETLQARTRRWTWRQQQQAWKDQKKASKWGMLVF